MSISVRGMSHAFGPVAVLDNVSLEAPGGSFISIVGPSGCGKSTLLRVLAGLLRPDAGEAEVSGKSTIERPGLVAYMPQKDLLLPWRRVLANATLGAEVAGRSKKFAREEAAALLPRFGLAGFVKAWPSQLSGGMRQRLALLRTFLTPASTMLLDEPFGALDAITRREMHSWLQEVLASPPAPPPASAVRGPRSGAANRTADSGPRTGGEGRVGGRTILFVTHDVEEALVLSDAVYVMSPRPGRIVARVEVPFPRPRAGDLVVEPEFVKLKAELLQALAGG